MCNADCAQRKPVPRTAELQITVSKEHGWKKISEVQDMSFKLVDCYLNSAARSAICLFQL